MVLCYDNIKEEWFHDKELGIRRRRKRKSVKRKQNSTTL